jgi:hypothetical protein
VIKNGGMIPSHVQTFNHVAGVGISQFNFNAIYNDMMTGDTIECRWKTALASTPSTNIKIAPFGFVETFKVTISATALGVVGASLLQNKRGKLGQWDFLKGILNMFNLLTVADPTNNQNIRIETYNTIFPRVGTSSGGLTLADRGIAKDWTDKIDAKEYNYKPLTSLKKYTEFQYAEDNNDYVFQNYKKAFGGFLYGSLSFDASGLNILTGTTKISAKPFAATVNKPFDQRLPECWIPAMYKLKDDGTSEEFDNKPRICYNNGKFTMTQGTFYIPPMNGGVSENASTFLQFSGFSDLPITNSTNDLNFGTCQLISQNNPTTLNLYNRFYAQYYADLYNPDTRIIKMKIKLNSADINQFTFSDIIVIKNRTYRVNKIDYNPGQLARLN